MGPHAVFDSAPKQAGDPLTTEVTRLHDRAAVVLARVDLLTGVSARLQLFGPGVDEPVELALVVKGRDDLVSAFVARGVVGVAAHDEAPSGVIAWIYFRHDVIMLEQMRRCGPYPMISDPVNWSSRAR